MKIIVFWDMINVVQYVYKYQCLGGICCHFTLIVEAASFSPTFDVTFQRTAVFTFVFIEWQIPWKFVLFIEPKIYYRVCKTLRRILKRANRIQYIYFVPVSLKSILVLSTDLFTRIPGDLSPSYCPSKDICAFACSRVGDIF